MNSDKNRFDLVNLARNSKMSFYQVSLSTWANSLWFFAPDGFERQLIRIPEVHDYIEQLCTNIADHFFNGHDKYYTNFVKLARDRTLDFFDLLHGNDDHYRFFAPKGGNVGRQLWLLTGYRDEFESYLDNMITRFTRRYS